MTQVKPGTGKRWLKLGDRRRIQTRHIVGVAIALLIAVGAVALVKAVSQ